MAINNLDFFMEAPGVSWQQLRSKSMDHLNTEPARVHARSNDGKDVYLEADTFIDALLLAAHQRNAGNYMVCIEIDNERTHRWDREFAVNANRWRKREPHAREPMGPLPSIYLAV